ncbi:translational GTPase TypA [Desulfobaculum bizertense]|uniref:Large ribosomal subunit assembly factor BipA n=1 Tax=Desulfobaculum bizertense DSM 18034 TaxID=1121442 RepID=A0A1T4VT67_9BACT|nr:translational GTPase TypA [Desulfobaculum bizertense]UIJ38448.1 translational GTPase TypA [Desulfobaculum bizertense]SKA68190.1 GTP-binding protein [Desulfobaculum bizertense DSM 18034]
MSKKTARNEALRNIAIIAHVDHGKTTLVDQMFKQSGVFREGQEVDDRVMDSMDLERERGITIAAKNCSIHWRDKKINIIDTPGHADFGGEVERSLSMCDGAILLVDASEGPLPQTRFVLEKALKSGLKIIVCINKIDRADARPDEVLDEVYDLLIDLGADEDQLEFPLFYAIGRQGIAKKSLDEEAENLHILLDAVIEEVPAPAYDPDAPFQMLVSDLSYSDYLGRLAIGRVFNGRAHSNEQLACIGENGQQNLRVTRLQTYDGTKVVETETATPGDIIVLSGIEDVFIGDTICTVTAPEALPRITVDEPTVSMRFGINTSPLAGQEGKHVTSSKIRDRLMREALSNVAIRVEDTDDRDAFMVKGRGEFQMAIIIETMRREGFELTVGRPEVILKEVDGKLKEPIEHLFIDCDEESMGIITEKLASRKGRMMNLVNSGSGRVRMEFTIPSRGLIGYRDEFLTDTKGTGIMNSLLEGYDDYRGDIPTRFSGSIVSDRAGKGVAYALFNLEPRGRLFVTPNDPVYEGMIVGEHNRENDIDVNPTKGKKLTNMRASGKDEAVTLTNVLPTTLEHALHFIREDELVEVTPESIRLRKVELNAQKRYQMAGRKKAQK